MSTHDYVIANQTGANTRSDLNNAFSAIVSNNSSASEPATMYAYQWWADTANDLLKQRNAANSAWISILTLSTGAVTSGGDPTMGGDLTGTASNAQIAANAVGLAEMAAGTDGNLITYDASGDPAYVTTGTSGQILTSGGAGVAPTFQTAAGGGDNTPSFCAYLSADQNVSADTSVKIQFNTEVFDTNSAYDNSSNYRFTVPSGEAGKYVIMMDVHGNNSDAGATSMNGYIYKNGALFRQVNNHLTANSINRMHLPLNFIDDASVSDYYECYVNLSGSSTKVEGGTGTFGSTFMMFKLII